MLSVKFAEKLPLILALTLSSLFSIALVLFRFILSDSLLFIFLIWNLFLAWIPFTFAIILSEINKYTKSKIIFLTLFLSWLLFFPNCTYIITDLFHFRHQQNIPLWYDLVMIFSFVWNGLILGFLSLIEIQKIINERFGYFYSWLTVFVSTFLSGFGIYLGRYLRWNSWDIITNPFALGTDILDRLINPLSYPQTLGVTLLFSTFLTISYLTLFVIVKPGMNE